ncbi:Ig domain-containing protein [Tropheryma whipplei]|uniref:Ig domain-containing protein n=1 Tax=Tropheryma whipplei TaxID=2039 RepID=UPI0005A04BE1|nr:Ig domain-containing protein [Tropheryma whipplei]
MTELPSQDLVVTVYKHASSVYMTQVLGPATYSLPNFVTYDTDPGVNRVPVYLFLNTTDGRLSGSVEANTGTYTFPVVVNGVYTVPYTVVVTELPSQDLVVTVYKHASSVYMTAGLILAVLICLFVVVHPNNRTTICLTCICNRTVIRLRPKCIRIY